MAKDVSPKLVTKATSCVLDKFERKINGKGAVRAEKWFTLVISNKDMDKIIKFVESLGKPGILNNGATETQKHETKKQESGFLVTNSSCGFFFDATYVDFIDQCYKKFP